MFDANAAKNKMPFGQCALECAMILFCAFIILYLYVSVWFGYPAEHVFVCKVNERFFTVVMPMVFFCDGPSPRIGVLISILQGVFLLDLLTGLPRLLHRSMCNVIFIYLVSTTLHQVKHKIIRWNRYAHVDNVLFLQFSRQHLDTQRDNPRHL